jgi:hypothetical protein
MNDDREADVFGGKVYGRLTPDGPLVEAPATATPDVWICRRVADFPRGQAPAGSAPGHCSRCTAPIAFNPARIPIVPPATPKVCMQCARIQPLPIEGATS